MRPAMVADLKPHSMDLSNFLPRHEVGCVGHPAVRHKERSAESQLLQQPCNERSMRLDGVVERQDHNSVTCSFLYPGWSVSILGRHRVASEQAQGKQQPQEAP